MNDLANMTVRELKEEARRITKEIRATARISGMLSPGMRAMYENKAERLTVIEDELRSRKPLNRNEERIEE